LRTAAYQSIDRERGSSVQPGILCLDTLNDQSGKCRQQLLRCETTRLLHHSVTRFRGEFFKLATVAVTTEYNGCNYSVWNELTGYNFTRSPASLQIVRILKTLSIFTSSTCSTNWHC